MPYTNPAFLLSSCFVLFFFFFIRPDRRGMFWLSSEIFATRAITSWKSTFTISFTKAPWNKKKRCCFPFYFSERESSGCFEKISESLYLFRIPRGIKLLLVFPPGCDIFDGFFYLSHWVRQLEEKKKKTARNFETYYIKTIGGIAQMFRHFPPAGTVTGSERLGRYGRTDRKFIFTLLSADDVFEWWTIDMVASSAPAPTDWRFDLGGKFE